jgi:fatty acid desaturase
VTGLKQRTILPAVLAERDVGAATESAPPPEPESSANALPAEELRRLQQRADRPGLVRLLGHFVAIFGTAGLYALCLAGSAPALVSLLAAVAYGFTLVTMFAAMHESVHRTAFKTRALNDGVGWVAGLLSFYNSTFYRHYHGWHHRFTQLPGRDPELEDGKPTSLGTYLLEVSGIPWWIGKLKTHATIALGRVEHYGFLNERTRPEVIRSVRWQMLAYGVAIAGSFALGSPLFVTYWLAPAALAQPLLRAILLAEHTGCSHDGNPLSNTRTTYTIWPVRFLMWEMPYHAEHHRWPALPFYALAQAHEALGPKLAHLERGGYIGMNRGLLKAITGKPTSAEPTA